VSDLSEAVSWLGSTLRLSLGLEMPDIVAICSPNETKAQSLAALCKELGVGEPKIYRDVREMVRDPNVDAVWLLAPNNVRVELTEAIADEVKSGRAELKGFAVEKPLARNLAEAKKIYQAITEAKINHGYLENQVYAPAVTKGKELIWRRGAAIAGEPYLARCAEEHSGPHRAWFWRGDLQGGGVLNDMLCHSALAGWYLLTPLGQRNVRAQTQNCLRPNCIPQVDSPRIRCETEGNVEGRT
jgi:predicted dehydrogenase